MILLLDTSTPVCRLTLIDGDNHWVDEWQANRQLADKLLDYLETQLAARSVTWNDLAGIGVFHGPGSFTGLRIGITILNTMAHILGVPIVGAGGDAWQDDVLAKLSHGNDEKIVLPVYGANANITKPRK